MVRVSVERLDALLNLVGELVIQNSGFHSVGEQLRNKYRGEVLVADLQSKTEALTKVTRDLQDGIMKVRMLPVNNVFSRFHRVVRDLAKDHGKEITLDIFGEETEIDKKVMDRIAEPLLHLVRNSADHGIESKEERLAAGKRAVGVIRLGAYQDGDHICVEVSDDGRGLDRDAILKKALEKGLVEKRDAGTLPDEKILGMIFLPGFSTARKVTETSGRGVGMDVVMRAVQSMGGTIRIRSTTGSGTKVTISLPLTMAILPGLLVEVSGSTLAIPLSSVKEVLKVGARELNTVGLRPVIRLRNEVLAVVELEDALGLTEEGSAEAKDERTPVVIVEFEKRKLGLGVGRIVGTGEVVIKSLSRHYREIPGLIGASILGNGKIALIVDVEALVRLYHDPNSQHRAHAGNTVFELLGDAGLRGEVSAEAAPAASAPVSTASTGTTAPAALETPVVPAATAPAAPVVHPTLEAAPPVTSEPAASATPEPAAPATLAPAVPEPAAPAEPEGPAPVSPAELMRELSNGGGALLEEIHNAGAIQASISVSTMTGRDVQVSFPESRAVPLADVGEMLGGEEAAVAGLYVGLNGELDGGILMVIPQETLPALDDLLHKRPVGTCGSLEDVDLSAISELGNILSAAFLNAMSDGTRLSIRHEPPEIGLDMCLSVIDSVLARFAQPGDELLLTTAELASEGVEKLTCRLVLFLEPASLRKLVGALAAAESLV
ncbi:MAG TPA: chemotaxis protein CheW [Spirochaetia bacterium]|nr:chemotaxis protein CheW [Spirochaetia bacterium]